MLDLDMSPYGPFVWTAYAISAAALGTMCLVIVHRASSVARRLARLEASA